MKSIGQVPLKFLEAQQACFTLQIQRRPLQPLWFPYSSKRLPPDRQVKHERLWLAQR
jgi:hypothetical protein